MLPISSVSQPERHHLERDQRLFPVPIMKKCQERVAKIESAKASSSASKNGTGGTEPATRKAAKVATAALSGRGSTLADHIHRSASDRSTSHCF